VAKILLADDNSNVHKTVALALAALGVEVSSVNNGDAAIKKLNDFSPDLILADIFMPVRSGYEVCEYVKKNSRFSQVPVVLLVGAFDPLDEREAQRVGADGILKKPFVPPDPLITMVTTLLQRVIGAPSAEPTASKDRVPVLAVAGKVAEDESPSHGENDSPEHEFAEPQEFASPSDRTDFGETHLPAAFSQLLEAARYASTVQDPRTAPEEQDHILTSQRDATLGEPIFWKSDSPDQESQEDSPLEPASGFEIPAWTQSADVRPENGEDDGSKPLEPLEFVSEEHDQTSTSIVDAQPVQLDLAAQSSLTVEPSPASDLAANPMEWLASVPHEPVSAASSESNEIETDTTAEKTRISMEDSVTEAEIAPVSLAEQSGMEVEPVQALEPEEYIAPVIDQSAAIETRPDETGHSAIHAVETPLESAVEESASPKKLDPDDTLPSAAEQWNDLSASISERANEIAARQGLSTSEHVAHMLSSGLNQAASSSVSLAHNTSPDAAMGEPQSLEAKEIANAKDTTLVSGTVSASTPDPALVEAVVQKVISKMSPQVVDIITREFLRPIVQALVHRAIEK